VRGQPLPRDRAHGDRREKKNQAGLQRHVLSAFRKGGKKILLEFRAFTKKDEARKRVIIKTRRQVNHYAKRTTWPEENDRRHPVWKAKRKLLLSL